MATVYKPCAVPECKGNALGPGRARGYCRAHYRRLLRHGDPLGGGTSMGARQRWIAEHANFAGSECLIWPFSRTDSGYPQFKVGGASTLASRVMCAVAHGQPPTPEHQAAHSCGRGNKGCMNPRHLRWATRNENEADKVVHGTLPRGERQGSSRLTSAQVREIRRLAGLATHREIATRYGVSRGHVGRILARGEWAWLD